MALRSFKPTSPGVRQMTVSSFEEITHIFSSLITGRIPSPCKVRKGMYRIPSALFSCSNSAAAFRSRICTG